MGQMNKIGGGGLENAHKLFVKMSEIRFRAKIRKPATGADTTPTTTTGTLRRSGRLLNSRTKNSDHCSVGTPGVRENAHFALDCSKNLTGSATITPTCLPRRSQRLLQSNVKSSYRCPSDDDFEINSKNDILFMSNMTDPPDVRGNAYNTLDCSKASAVAAMTTPACHPRRSQRLLHSNIKSSYRGSSGSHEIAQNTFEATTVLRRSKRLLQSKTASLKSCSFGAHEIAQNTLEATTVLRRSKRLLQSKTGSLKSCSFDANAQQGHGLLKNPSAQRSGKSISSVKIGPVRLNFDDVGNVKCHDPIGKIGGSSERRIVCSLPVSIPAHIGGGKSELRFRDNDVGLRQGKDSMKSLSLTVNIGKFIQKDNDANQRCVEELEGTSSESDSPLVSKLKKRCFRKTSKGKKGVGVKRKKKQNDDIIQETDSGWTKEQEKALQRAYLAAKPTPNFWKRVARLVPGKSSQECFDKVNSENLTPQVQPPRSRSKRKTMSPLHEISFSDAELVSEPKSKRKSRRKSHVNQKMVRNLMRKNSHRETDKADFFCVLEPTVNPLLPLSPVLSTPTGSEEKGSYSGCRSLSLSNQKKSKSRFSGKSEIPIASPPVLKPVRNLALHDKYVDQLHAREAKRKTRSTLFKGELNEPLLKNKDAVQAAKESLISDARDVISKFRHSEMNMKSFNDPEDGCDHDYDEDEDEDEDDENAL